MRDHCSLNTAVQSAILAVLLAELKNAGRLQGVRTVFWGGLGRRGPPDLQRRIAAASVNSPAWSKFTDDNRRTRFPKTPRDPNAILEVINDRSVFPEMANVLAAMGFRMTATGYEWVMVERAAEVPALAESSIPSESVVPVALPIWLVLEEAEAWSGAASMGVETRDDRFDALRYSYVSDDCEIGFVRRDPESGKGDVPFVDAACTLDFAVQAGLTGILVAELKNAGRLGGITRIHWRYLESPSVIRRLALAFHDSPGVGRVRPH